jgi:hypothetical protein
MRAGGLLALATARLAHLLAKRSTNARGQRSRLSLSAQRHRRGGHDEEPSHRVAGAQEPDHLAHHSSRVEESQDDHAEMRRRLLPFTGLIPVVLMVPVLAFNLYGLSVRRSRRSL